MDLDFGVAMRAHHGVWLGPGPRVRSTSWQPVDWRLPDGRQAIRPIGEIMFGQRRDMRSDQISTDPATRPEKSTCVVMTNLAQAVRQEVANLAGMRLWMADGFKQSQQALGWSDVRVTSDPAMEQGWEMVSSASLMGSLPAEGLSRQRQASLPPEAMAQEWLTTHQDRTAVDGGQALQEARAHVLRQQQWWHAGKGWKPVWKNRRLLIQPFVTYSLLSLW